MPIDLTGSVQDPLAVQAILAHRAPRAARPRPTRARRGRVVQVRARAGELEGGTPVETYLDMPQRKSTCRSPCAEMITVRVSV